MKICEDCILAKIKRKNIIKMSSNKSTKPGERLLIDISYVKKESLGGKNIWILIEDQATSMKWSTFVRRNGGMVKVVTDFVVSLRNKNKELVRFIRVDNAGENKAVKASLEKEGQSVAFEFSSPNTPEQNGQMERSFATLRGRVRAMLNGAGVPTEMRDSLWAECESTATKLCNLMRMKGDTSSYELFYQKEAPYYPSLRAFGEMGIKKTKLYGLPEKLANKGSL
jgi:hypothetical protein